MTSVNGDVLACVEEAVPWRDVLREHNCDRAQMDAHATKICTDYTGLSTKRAQILARYHARPKSRAES